ncbi:MAG: hypothetical protein COC19_07460 [SAR86 cluster bacterium]|uniref:DUF975 family protein n=1 Tax=SAR86 cluster bacterium TaxID=2030880 RepID=A0A2A4MHG8_9GAMM|nr:MAG: hypothetical protein COC19_07460 [SAR86 cluster bacterium]
MNTQNDGKQIAKFEPGVWAALSYGWGSMKKNFLVFFLVVLVLMVLDAFLDAPTKMKDSTWAGLLLFAFWVLLKPVIEFGADLVFLQGVRGDEVKVGTIFDGFNNFINVILTSLLLFGLIGISFLFFIIPGIYVACRLVFASYLVMDEGLDPVAAVEDSWDITRGHTWEIFCLGFVSLFIIIGGLLLLIVGLIPAVMWIKSAFAALYLSCVDSNEPETITP